MADEAMPGSEPAAAAPSNRPARGGFVSNPLALLPLSLEALKVNLSAVVLSVAVPLGLLALVVLVVLGGSLAAGPAALMAGGLIGAVLLLAVFVVFAPAWTIIMLSSAKGQKITFMEALKRAPKYFVSFLAAGILTGLAVLGGLLLLIVPGLIFLAWFVNAGFFIIEENVGAIDAMKRSKQLAKGHVVEILGVILFTTAAGILGIVPIIGALAAVVISILYMAAPALRYVQLKSLPPGTPAKPHWANWAVIVLAVLASGMDFQENKKLQDGQQNLQSDFQYDTEDL